MHTNYKTHVAPVLKAEWDALLLKHRNENLGGPLPKEPDRLELSRRIFNELPAKEKDAFKAAAAADKERLIAEHAERLKRGPSTRPEDRLA